MKKTFYQLKLPVLLTVISLLAFGPALCLVKHHAYGQPDRSLSLGSGSSAGSSLGSDSRADQLTSASGWKSNSKRTPEIPKYFQKVFKAKALGRMADPKGSLLTALRNTPRHFLVLRI